MWERPEDLAWSCPSLRWKLKATDSVDPWCTTIVTEKLSEISTCLRSHPACSVWIQESNPIDEQFRYTVVSQRVSDQLVWDSVERFFYVEKGKVERLRITLYLSSISSRVAKIASDVPEPFTDSHWLIVDWCGERETFYSLNSLVMKILYIDRKIILK